MNLEFLFSPEIQALKLPVRSDAEYIRIEKQILLQTKLGNSLDKNEAEQILTILKHYGDELNLLFRDSNLSHFLLKKRFALSEVNYQIEKSNGDAFNEFLSNYFSQNFKESIDYYLKENLFSEIISLRFYTEILPVDVLEHLSNRLEIKLSNAIHKLNSIQSESKLKVEAKILVNPDFYEVLNVYPSYEVESKIRKIIDISADEINQKNGNRNNFLLKILYTMKQYDAIDEELDDIIQGNYRYAAEKLDKIKSFFSHGIGRFSFLIVIVVLKLLFYASDYLGSNNSDNTETEYNSMNFTKDGYNYILYNAEECNNSEFFNNLNLLSYHVKEGTGSVVSNNLERDINLKMMERYDVKNFLKIATGDNLTSLNFINKTDKSIYVFLNRDCSYKNSLLIVSPKSNSRLYLFYGEKFKLLINHDLDTSNFKLTDFYRNEADILNNEYYLTKSIDSAEQTFEINQSFKQYKFKLSDGITAQ